MNKTFLYIFLLLVSTLVQCKKENLFETNAEHHFFLETDRAFLPITVEGNTTSKTFLLVVHGGPGGTGQIYNTYGSFTKIEEEFAVVYYDQRCAGNAQGNCDLKILGVETHIQDLEKIIDLIKFKYGDDSDLFMLGHSWGGTLGLSYLIDHERQQKIKGAFIISGPQRFDVYASRVVDMIEFYGDQQIAIDKNKGPWKSLLNDVDERSSPSVDNITTTNLAAQTAQKLMSDSISTVSLDLSLNDIIGSIFGSDGTGRFIQFMNNLASTKIWDELLTYDISSQLENITIPMAIYWGKFDFIVPPVFGNEIHDLIGSNEKECFEFPNSDHSPMLTERSDFNQKVLQFIYKYK